MKLTPRLLPHLAETLTDAGIAVPEAINTAAAQLDFLDEHAGTKLPADVLSLTGEDLLAHMANATLAHVPGDVYLNHLAILRDTIAAAAADAINVDALVLELRPRFDAAAQVFADALTAGIRYGMRADDVIALGTPEALASWQMLDEAAAELAAIAAIRRAIYVDLDVVQYDDLTSPDWLMLAASGSLHLSTPSEREKQIAQARSNRQPLGPTTDPYVVHAAALRAHERGERYNGTAVFSA